MQQVSCEQNQCSHGQMFGDIYWQNKIMQVFSKTKFFKLRSPLFLISYLKTDDPCDLFVSL